MNIADMFWESESADQGRTRPFCGIMYKGEEVDPKVFEIYTVTKRKIDP